MEEVEVKKIRVLKQRLHSDHVARPLVSPVLKLNWPDHDYFYLAQNAVDSPTGEGFALIDDIWYFHSKIWIPETATEAKHVLLVIAHFGIAGHSGVAGTLSKLKEFVYWHEMKEDVESFILDCILCRCTKAPQPTRLHLGEPAARPTKPNMDVHFDFFKVTLAADGNNYLLVIRDGFSRFAYLKSCPTADAENAVSGLLEWIGLFGIPKRFFSDNGSHFRNKCMDELKRRLLIAHDFSTVYCAWSNGLIERIMRDIRALILILLHELRLGRNEWPKLVSLLMFVLNQRNSRVLGNYKPVQVHMGLEGSNPLTFFVDPKTEKFYDLVWNIDMEKSLSVLQSSLDAVHEKVFVATSQAARQARKRLPNLPEFEIGDFVLYSLVDRPHKEGKLYFQWIGPMQIMEIKSKYVYHIRDLVSNKLWDAHVTRLSFYSTKKMHVRAELKELIALFGVDYDIEKLKALTYDTDAKQYKICVIWKGLTELEESWEPFRELIKQVPKLVVEFLKKEKEKGFVGFGVFLKKEKKFLTPACTKYGIEL